MDKVVKQNTYQLAKSALAEAETKRADMLCKLRNEQTELEQRKVSMVGHDADEKYVQSYSACKDNVDAYMSVLEDMDRVRIPAVKAKVSHEKTVVSTTVQEYCSKRKAIAVIALTAKFEEVLKLIDAHATEVAVYSKEQGNPIIPSRLARIGINDMSREIRRLLGI